MKCFIISTILAGVIFTVEASESTGFPQIDLASVVSMIELDPCLKEIVKTPHLFNKINQKHLFSDENYNSLRNESLVHARYIGGKLLGNGDLKALKISICVADARLYFWDSTNEFDVIGWLGIGGLAKETQHKMTVWIVPKSKVALDGKSLDDYAKVLAFLVDSDSLNEKEVRDLLDPKLDLHNIRIEKSGRLVQLIFDLKQNESFAKTKKYCYVSLLENDELSFWPPWKLDMEISNEIIDFARSLKEQENLGKPE